MASLVYGHVLVVCGLVLPCLPAPARAPAPAQAELFYVFLLLVSCLYLVFVQCDLMYLK